MCESKVYLDDNGEVKLLAEDIIYLKCIGSEYVAIDIQGKEYRITGYKLKNIDFLNHRIVFGK